MTTAAPSVSAVVCTLNRPDYLRKALASLAEQTAPAASFEIVVVDNGSTSETPALVEGEFGQVPNLRYVYEPINGISQARNCGWRNARGEYVAYLDDDAIARPDWIEQMLVAFAAAPAQVSCIAGRVEPIWEAPRPPWLPSSVVGYLSILHWSNEPVVMNEFQWFLTTNCAFRRQVLDEIGGFSTRLGRTGRTLRSNEEIMCKWEMGRRGYSCLYHPDVIVAHHIPSARLTKRWFLQRAFWQGVSQAVVRTLQEPPSTLQRARMGFSSLVKLRREDLMVRLRPTEDPYHFATQCRVQVRLGYVLGIWGLAR